MSKKNFEHSTENVIDWLRYKNQKFIRLNGEDFYNKSNINNLKINGLDFECSEIKVVWFRRWLEADYLNQKMAQLTLKNNEVCSVFRNLNMELKTLKVFLDSQLAHAFWLSHPSELNMNKLKVLNIAGKCGLKTPSSLITTSKKKLVEFISTEKKVITKPLSEVVNFYSIEQEGNLEYRNFYSSKTVLITKKVLSLLNSSFFPSLFQKMINKAYEIRVFFLKNELYSMAIFSQLDSKTQIDFRNYNDEKPNRRVPYKLPKEITYKLQKLIDKIGVTTGSIDLIRDSKGEYFFLEINPVGQYGMTSEPCNYYLDEKIANHLIKLDNGC